MAPREEPERTCVGCRATAGKRELVRIVRSPDGSVHVDRTGSAHGRGAYVHRDAACVDAALRRGSLARALKAGLGPEEVGRLRSEIVAEFDGA